MLFFPLDYYLLIALFCCSALVYYLAVHMLSPAFTPIYYCCTITIYSHLILCFELSISGVHCFSLFLLSKVAVQTPQTVDMELCYAVSCILLLCAIRCRP